LQLFQYPNIWMKPIKEPRVYNQRIQITLQSITRYQRATTHHVDRTTTALRMVRSIKRLIKQQDMLQKSLEKTTSLCFNIAEDRNKHIQAIEAARQKKIYDNMKEFQDEAIKTQNGQEYTQFMSHIKNQIFEDEFYETNNANNLEKMPAHARLAEYIPE